MIINITLHHRNYLKTKCILLKLSVVFQHPRCALSSLNACAEAQINLPVSSCRDVSSVSSSFVAVAGNLKAVYKADKARSSLVAAVSLNGFSHTPVIFSMRLCWCFVRTAQSQQMSPEDMGRAGGCPCALGQLGGEMVWREVTSWKKNRTKHPTTCVPEGWPPAEECCFTAHGNV